MQNQVIGYWLCQNESQSFESVSKVEDENRSTILLFVRLNRACLQATASKGATPLKSTKLSSNAYCYKNRSMGVWCKQPKKQDNGELRSIHKYEGKHVSQVTGNNRSCTD
ncbi:hypothetical protein AVEN_271417-1 [Araneus ventricosus]|uniref:Uncharacterized protein n=1 Tax=Araneus ventricosus TaxID=182803 RepID=A0A4Y2H542_ARAVE|nr:hypothetical protein AVEN_271417-1 [Araneus ventricosus]